METAPGTTRHTISFNKRSPREAQQRLYWVDDHRLLALSFIEQRDVTVYEIDVRTGQVLRSNSPEDWFFFLNMDMHFLQRATGEFMVAKCNTGL